MSETNHKPGPWELEENDGYGPYSIFAGKQKLAIIVGDSAETEANARLMTAAPDMLKALKDYVAALPQFWASDTHCTETKPDEADYLEGEWLDIAAKARAAIAKAEGHE